MKKLASKLGVVVLVIHAGALCWAQEPELVVQTGHSDLVTSVAFSPDGNTLASGSFDNTIKLWEANSGKELRTLRTLSGHFLVASVAFSPDGKTLASASSDNTVRLWNVISGEELRTLVGHSEEVNFVAFSPDGKTLASGCSDKTIRLWEVATGRELRTLAGHSSDVWSVVFSPDGKSLASRSGDKTIRLWDVATGKEMRTLDADSGSHRSVIAFSPDGKTLASPGWLGNMIKLWDVPTGRELHTLGVDFREIGSIAFSPDGETLAGGSSNKSIDLWNVTTGRKLRSLVGHADDVNSVMFSPDGKTLVSGSDDKTIKLWNVLNGKNLRTMAQRASYVLSVAFSPNGKTLASGSSDQTVVKLWELVTGKEQTFAGHTNWVNTVAFSPIGNILASGSDDNTIKLWDLISGREIRTLARHTSGVHSVVFSPDGQTLASGSFDDTIKLWDVTSGNELRTMVGHAEGISSVAFSPDGKILASGSWDNTIKFWDAASGKEIETLTGHSDRVHSVVFSADGKILASGSSDRTIKLWDVASRKELRTLVGNHDSVRSVTFSADGKTLASASNDRIVRLWRIDDGKEIRTLDGHSGYVLSVAFSPDKKTLASGSADSTIKLWSASGEELVSLVALDQDEGLVVTPEGLFDGTPNGWSQILWRFNNNTFEHAPVEAFFKEYWRPGLLADIFSGKAVELPKKDFSAIDIRQPVVRVATVNGEPAIEEAPGQPVKLIAALRDRETIIEVQVTDNAKAPSRTDQPARSGAKDLRLFRNGSLVRAWAGNLFEKNSGCDTRDTKLNEPRRVICKTSVALVAGENRFTAYAFNHEDVKSIDAELVATGSDSLKRTGTLYVLAAGVGENVNRNFKLDYAAKDASAFSDEIKVRQQMINRYAKTEVRLLLNQEATKENVLGELKRLAAVVQPEDGLVIYFSGHGTVEGKRFFMLPFDIGYMGLRTKDAISTGNNLATILNHSISDEDLEQVLRIADAGQIVMVIDACHSGQALNADDPRRGPMNSTGLAQLAYEKGMYILAASQDAEVAYESAALGHSYLTYALIEQALKAKTRDADANKDGQIDLREWFDYAAREVPRLREQKVEELTRKPRAITARVPVRTKQLEEVQVAERAKVQTPRPFYRREVETQPFIIAKIAPRK